MIREMSKDRCCESCSGLKLFGCDNRFAALLGSDLIAERERLIDGNPRVKNYGDTLFVFIGVFADGQLQRACRCFPVA